MVFDFGIFFALLRVLDNRNYHRTRTAAVASSPSVHFLSRGTSLNLRKKNGGRGH